MEPENLQSVLQEAGIQVDMKNLQNPTEEFMVYLITEYLNKFHFDGNEISKSTAEQLDCLSCPDSASDAIRIINLFTSLSTVCNEIFLQDLCLTDITSPGPKRARRQIKILFNFFAYFRNKMVENEMIFMELDNQQKDIEEMINKKDSITAQIGAMINDHENKLELKEQLQQEIEEISVNMENNSKQSKELEYQVKEIMMQYQNSYKKCNDLKTKAVKLHKLTTELQSKIVKSPEEYAARSKELKKVLEIKQEERQVLNDSIMRKKIQIKNNENAQELVKSLNDKFVISTNETCKKLKETTEDLENVQKQLDLLNVDIEKWTNIETNSSTTVLHSDDLKGHKQLLFELNNQCTDKEREFNSQNNVLEEMKAELTKNKSQLEVELKTILSVQKSTSELIRQCKEHLENRISEENTLQQAIVNTLFNSNGIML